MKIARMKKTLVEGSAAELDSATWSGNKEGRNCTVLYSAQPIGARTELVHVLRQHTLILASLRSTRSAFACGNTGVVFTGEQRKCRGSNEGRRADRNRAKEIFHIGCRSIATSHL